MHMANKVETQQNHKNGTRKGDKFQCHSHFGMLYAVFKNRRNIFWKA